MNFIKSAVVLGFCAYNAHAFTANNQSSWSYNPMSSDSSNTAGQGDWWQLFPACGGQKQSPININNFVDYNRNAKLLLQGTCPVAQLSRVENLKWNAPTTTNCSLQRLSDQTMFSFSQMHIHSPSEHTIYGSVYDGEVHFVHSNPNGGYLVIAALLDCSAAFESPWLESVLNTASQPEGTTVNVLDPYANLISGGRTFFNYAGSLTSPPCNENVDWWIASEPVLCNNDQLSDLRRALKTIPQNWYARNARAIQPINNRPVTRIV